MPRTFIDKRNALIVAFLQSKDSPVRPLIFKLIKEAATECLRKRKAPTRGTELRKPRREQRRIRHK